MEKPPQNLVNLFRQIDVDEPDSWASSELNERDISQVSRATILRNVADLIVRQSEIDMIKRAAEASPHGIAALKKLEADDVDWGQVAEICRQVLSSFTWQYFRMVDGIDEMPVNPANLFWQLNSFDESGRQVGSADGLYESIYRMLGHVSGRENW